MSIKGVSDADLWEMLFAVEKAAPVDAVQVVARRLAVGIEATAASFLVADLGGRALVRMVHLPDLAAADPGRRNGEAATVLPFDGGPQERALRSQRVQVEPGADGTYVVTAPVTERGETIGVLELTFPAEPDEAALDAVGRGAHVLAYVVIAARRHTDLFEWSQRTTPFNLAAEIQRRLLPSAFTCEAAAFTLSAWLEPAATVGGDTFDYSLARDVLHMSITDAMGHGVDSALLASLSVGSLRNSRRLGRTLTEQAAFANQTLKDHPPAGFGFATGLIARLDLHTGRLHLVNAGHIPPLLVRGGVVEELRLPIDLPFGIRSGQQYRTTEMTLRPGDRLVLLTDGMLERRGSVVDLNQPLLAFADAHPREVVRALTDAVLATGGPALADDASLLVLDWYGDHAGAGDHPGQ
ncbi:PP2C family protein-serine/threonine phosphatase [Cryptosporangium arvum]|uniref:PP2C family protein-serine/threonine phosphatase n=1 Tax=Cryptosporangium arvum TaxID=80871 RepID=UPI0004B7E536|nr:PP2C family protein-serine/threonine phosphatase [Cryptosporangium arvum]